MNGLIKYIISTVKEKEKQNKTKYVSMVFFKGERLQNFQTGRGSPVRSLGLQ